MLDSAVPSWRLETKITLLKYGFTLSVQHEAFGTDTILKLEDSVQHNILNSLRQINKWSAIQSFPNPIVV